MNQSTAVPAAMLLPIAIVVKKQAPHVIMAYVFSIFVIAYAFSAETQYKL